MIVVKHRIYIKPNRLWMLYIPGAFCLFMGVLMLLVPKVFILVMAALLIGFALLLLYLTTKFCMFVKDLKEKEDVSEIGIPEAIDRFWEQRASESRWIN